MEIGDKVRVIVEQPHSSHEHYHTLKAGDIVTCVDLGSNKHRFESIEYCQWLHPSQYEALEGELDDVTSLPLAPIKPVQFSVDETKITPVIFDESPETEVKSGFARVDVSLEGWPMDQVIITIEKCFSAIVNGLELGPGTYTRSDLEMLQSDTEGEEKHVKDNIDEWLTPKPKQHWLTKMAKLPC